MSAQSADTCPYSSLPLSLKGPKGEKGGEGSLPVPVGVTGPRPCYNRPMPKTPPMYTGFGDGGQTGLLYGGRVSKADPRCEAYGALDEAVSAMGLGRALSPKQDVREILLALQRESFTVGGEIAIDTDFYPKFLKHFQKVTADMVDKLEDTTDSLSEKIELPREFVMPGGSPAGAAIDLARSTVRRAERRTVELMDTGLLTNSEIPRYLNRLSSLLFVLARYEETV